MFWTSLFGLAVLVFSATAEYGILNRTEGQLGTFDQTEEQLKAINQTEKQPEAPLNRTEEQPGVLNITAQPIELVERCEVIAQDMEFKLDGCEPVRRKIEVCGGVCISFNANQRDQTRLRHCSSCKPKTVSPIRKIRLMFTCSGGIQRTYPLYYYKPKQCECL